MKPIGVFDSGVGGLTVARAVMERWPQLPIVYLGDTARVPYGPKSPSTIQRFSRENGDFLADHGIGALVVACNTASALALDLLVERYDFPVIGVLEPGVKAGIAAARAVLASGGTGQATGTQAAAAGGRPALGVIGTVGTVRSAAYERAAARLAPGLPVVSRPCPLFVPLAEENMGDHPATELIARDYLLPLLEQGIRALVLGCTHYPLLMPVIQRVVGPQVQLVDSAHAVASELARVLPASATGAAATAAKPAASGARSATPLHRFFVTDTATRFSEIGARFLGTALPAVELADFITE
jgi:glutamate racemase